MTDFAIKTDADVPLALKAAQPSDTLTFAAGDYGPVRTGGKWVGPGIALQPAKGAAVAIHSGKPDAQGRVQGPLTFDGASGVTVRDLELNIANGSLGVWCGGAVANIHLIGLDIHGPIVPAAQIPAKTGVAIHFGVGSVNCSVEACDIHHHGQGIMAVARSGLSLLNNHIHDIVSEAIHVATGAGGRIIGNDARRFYTAQLVHADGIQIVTMGTAWPSDAEIRRNRLTRDDPASSPVQGIFAQDDARQGLVLVVEENCVSLGNQHGISLYNVAGGRVRSNYVTGDAGVIGSNGKPIVPWISPFNSPNVVFADNIGTSGYVAVTIPLAPAGDFSAADAWDSMLKTGRLP